MDSPDPAPPSISRSAEPEGSNPAQFLPGSAEAGQVRKWRRGDVGPDGRVFAGMQAAGGGGRVPWWVTPEHFQRRRAAFNAARRTRYKTDEGYREKIKAKVGASGKERYHRDPSWRKKKLRKTVARSRTRRKEEPGFREREVARAKEAAQNPENRRRRRAREKQRLREDLRFAIAKRLRCRIRNAVTRGLKKFDKAGTAEGLRFLLWLAEKRGLKATDARLHIDHLWPLSRWDGCPHDWLPNGPENVRWSWAEENLSKHAALPSAEEVAAHLQLVEDWKKETQPQNPA